MIINELRKQKIKLSKKDKEKSNMYASLLDASSLINQLYSSVASLGEFATKTSSPILNHLSRPLYGEETMQHSIAANSKGRDVDVYVDACLSRVMFKLILLRPA